MLRVRANCQGGTADGPARGLCPLRGRKDWIKQIKTNTHWPKCAGKEATVRQSCPEEVAAGNQLEVLEGVWLGWTPEGWRVRYGRGQIRGRWN